MLSEICHRTPNDWAIRLIDSSRGEIDLILYSPAYIVLCEVKASPLVAFPLAASYDEPLEEDVEGEKCRIERHITTDVPDWKKRPLHLFLYEANRSITLRKPVQESGRISLIRSMLGRKQKDLAEDLQVVIKFWQRLMEGYSSRWKDQSELRWYTFGCGGGVDDSKNAPGLDRTDDIKKGLYQSLKLADNYRMGCVQQRLKVALLSNVHPITHYADYLQGFEDAVWTHERKIHDDPQSPEWKRARSSDLSPFYDMLFTLTRSWFRDTELERAFGLTTLYRVLGGKR